MYDPKESVWPYFKRLTRTPEGSLFLVLASSYALAFLFFGYLVEVAMRYDAIIGGEYRIVFLLMPLLLLAGYLRMDISANSLGDRLMTIFVLLLLSSVPIYRIFR